MSRRPIHPSTWNVHKGDSGTLHVLLDGVDATSNLDAVTAVSAEVWRDGDTVRGTMTGAVLVSADRTVELTYTSWLAGVDVPASTHDPDVYNLVTLVTTPTGTERFPEDGHDRLVVWA